METYYKVVRPDLASFLDPDFSYQIGKTRQAPGPRPESPSTCRSGILHAATSAPKAARYGQWPYRLLSVAGKPVTAANDEKLGFRQLAVVSDEKLGFRQLAVVSDEKLGFRQLAVVSELDVAECFGPNGAAVLRVVRQAESLTPEQVSEPYAAGNAAWDAAWYAAWDAALAACVSDLIGQGGYTQDHHDILMAPWISVFGEPS